MNSARLPSTSHTNDIRLSNWKAPSAFRSRFQHDEASARVRQVDPNIDDTLTVGVSDHADLSGLVVEVGQPFSDKGHKIRGFYFADPAPLVMDVVRVESIRRRP